MSHDFETVHAFVVAFFECMKKDREMMIFNVHRCVKDAGGMTDDEIGNLFDNTIQMVEQGNLPLQSFATKTSLLNSTDSAGNELQNVPVSHVPIQMGDYAGFSHLTQPTVGTTIDEDSYSTVGGGLEHSCGNQSTASTTRAEHGSTTAQNLLLPYRALLVVSRDLPNSQANR